MIGTWTRVMPSASSPIVASPLARAPLTTSTGPKFSVAGIDSLGWNWLGWSGSVSRRAETARPYLGIYGRSRRLAVQNADGLPGRLDRDMLARFLRVPGEVWA